MVNVRLAKWEELPRLARICTLAFQHEPNQLHPKPLRSVYPEDWYRGVLRDLQQYFIDQASVVIVGELDEEENGVTKTKIAGCITGTRYGSDGRPMTTWAQRVTELGIQKPTRAQVEEYHRSTFAVDRSADPAAIAYYDQALADVIGGSFANTIKVQILTVLPQHQRSGVGKALLSWCCRHSMQEGVPAVGRATATGVPIYLKAGAEIVGYVEMAAKTVRPEGMDVTIELEHIDVPVIKFGAFITMPQSKSCSENVSMGFSSEHATVIA